MRSKCVFNLCFYEHAIARFTEAHAAFGLGISHSHWLFFNIKSILVVVALLFYIHGEHLKSCQDGQLT